VLAHEGFCHFRISLSRFILSELALDPIFYVFTFRIVCILSIDAASKGSFRLSITSFCILLVDLLASVRSASGPFLMFSQFIAHNVVPLRAETEVNP